VPNLIVSERTTALVIIVAFALALELTIVLGHIFIELLSDLGGD
jgi:hypothetical protein